MLTLNWELTSNLWFLFSSSSVSCLILLWHSRICFSFISKLCCEEIRHTIKKSYLCINKILQKSLPKFFHPSEEIRCCRCNGSLLLNLNPDFFVPKSLSDLVCCKPSLRGYHSYEVTGNP